MRLEQILDETLELLIANEQDPRFKNFGALQKSKFQHSKPEEDAFLRSDMYKGTKVNSDAVKRGYIKRKTNPKYKEINKKAAQKRSNWYKSKENKEKFMEAIRRRKKPVKASKTDSQTS